MAALSVREWYDATDKFNLTIDDVESLKPGDKIKVLIEDRNIGDRIYFQKYPKNIPMKAVDFFECCSGIYTHKEGMNGTLVFKDGTVLEDFSFHLNFCNFEWYPMLDTGLLPLEDWEMINIILPKYGSIEPDWRKYPKSTRIGYRGPMLLWKDVETAPDIYYS